MFADCLERHAGRVLAEVGDATLRYDEVLSRGRRLLGPLPAPRSLVVLKVGLDTSSIAAHLSLLADGHVPLLIERTLSPLLADELIARYRPAVVVDPAEGMVEPGPGRTDPVEVHAELGLLLATSGSTGSPKLVRLSATGVRANADAIASYLALDQSERPLLHLPMSYSYGLSIIHSHVVAGATLVCTGRSVMEPEYWQTLADRRCTSIAGVPFHYAAIRRLGEARLEIPSLRTLTQAGGRLDPRLVGHFAAWAERTGRRFVVMYGQTEAGPRICYLPPERALEAPESIGIPIPGVEIDLLDEDGTPVPAGVPGEMRVTSPAVMLGYATEAADLARGDDLNGVLHTGDLATRGPDGLLRIVGRKARMLKIYGLRVNLDEVEARLVALGHAAQVGGADDELRVLLEDAADPAEVRQALVGLFALPPRGIQVRATAPVGRTPSGKVSAEAFGAAWEAAAQ